MAHRQDHDLSPPSRHRQFENRELHILRDAAGLIRIPLWKILRLAEPCHAPIPSRSPPGRSDGIEPRRSWTDDELICLNAAANIIPVGLVRLLVLGELGDPDVPEDGQGRNGVSDIGYGGSPGGVIEMNDQHVSPEGHGTAEEYPGNFNPTNSATKGRIFFLTRYLLTSEHRNRVPIREHRHRLHSEPVFCAC